VAQMRKRLKSPRVAQPTRAFNNGYAKFGNGGVIFAMGGGAKSQVEILNACACI
jgi:hypothetical protein